MSISYNNTQYNENRLDEKNLTYNYYFAEYIQV